VLRLRRGILESAATIMSGTAPPRCSPPWRSPPARSPTPATPGTGARSFSSSYARSPGLPAPQAAYRRAQLRLPQAPDIRTWLARNPRITLHFAPTSGSWLNVVEISFSMITRQAIRCCSFASVKNPIAEIEKFIDGWNGRCHPFTWTKTADELLPHCQSGKRTSFTRH